MTQVIIDDILPRTQLVATAGQTVFNTNWTADEATDVDVYAYAHGVDPDDVTQIVNPSNYVITFIGGQATVRVTFNSGRTLNDIITIVRNTPSTRENLYINTNFTPSMLNQDFSILTLVDQQNQLYDLRIAPHYNLDAIIDPVIDIILPILEANQIWAMNPTRTKIIAYGVPASGSLAPGDAKYIIQTADADLPDAVALDTYASGIMINHFGVGFSGTRILTGVTNQTAILNGDGVAGNPTVGLANNAILPGTASFTPPKGTTGQRPGSPVDGMIRYNTTLGFLETYDSGSWQPFVGGLVDSVVGTAHRISVDNTDPENPIVDIASDYVGQTSITTLGTITTGEWNGVTIVPLYGGLGISNTSPHMVSLNAIYVSPNGSDTTGNGSILFPYATYEHARSSLTASATIFNQFVLYMLGRFEITGDLTLSPYINVCGSDIESSFITLTGEVKLDASFATTVAPTTIIQSLALLPQSNINLTFSAYQDSKIIFNNVDFLYTAQINAVGSATNALAETIIIENCYSPSQTAFYSFTNTNAVITNSNIAAVNFINSSTATVTNLTLANSNVIDPIGFITFSTTSTGTQTGLITASPMTGTTFTIDGTLSTVKIDAASYQATPQFLNGATIAQVVPISMSDGMLANVNFTPSHYTPTATADFLAGSVTGNLKGIDAALGGVALINISDDTTTNATRYPVWVAGTGNQAEYISTTKISFNPSTGTLTSTLMQTPMMLDSNGVNILGFSAQANAVHWLTVLNSDVDPIGNPGLLPAGPAADINLALYAKGTGIPTVLTTGNIAWAAHSGTAYQHKTVFVMSDTSGTRTVTFQDADGTVAYLSDIPALATPVLVAGTSQSAAVDTTYILLNAGQTTVTLPAVYAIGAVVKLVGATANTGGWILTAAGGDTIRYNNATTSSGGTLTSAAAAGQTVEVMCDVANSSWVVTSTVNVTLTTA